MKNVFLIVFAFLSTLAYSQEADSIQRTARLFDLQFDQKEVDQMNSNLKEFRYYYGLMHSQNIEMSVPYNLVFIPQVNFDKIPTKQEKINWEMPKKVKMPSNKQDLAFYTVGELSYLIKNKKISSTELTQIFIERLKKYSGELECLITLTDSLAYAQAQRADQELAKGIYRGPLHGIPYGAKDLLSTKNYKTTWGAMPYKDQYINYDAEVVKRLENAGAVLVAKLTLGALAMGDVWYGGKTRNPWNLQSGSNGSSAGSASAVVAGLVPFAIGTETYGSIVTPSTICGASGLRPTFGRVSRDGAMVVSWSMDKIGPICRNSLDLALVFEAIRGEDGKDLAVRDKPFNYNYKVKDVKKLRVGYLKETLDNRRYSFKGDSTSIAILKNSGIELIEKSFESKQPYDALITILFAEAGASFDQLTRSGQDDLLVQQDMYAWPNIYRSSRFIPAVEYIQANRIRSLLIDEFNELMKDIDVLIAPSHGNQLFITNLTGHPVVVVPNVDYSKSNQGTLSLIGNHFDEATILELARFFQEQTDFEDIHPDKYKQ